MTESNASEAGAAPETEEDLSDRAAGAVLADEAEKVLAEDDRTPVSELEKRTRAERVAEAQLMALQALYLELRHGHDQAREQTEVLSSHATAMGKLRGAMYDHASAMGKLEGALDDHAHALRRWRG